MWRLARGAARGGPRSTRLTDSSLRCRTPHELQAARVPEAEQGRRHEQQASHRAHVSLQVDDGVAQGPEEHHAERQATHDEREEQLPRDAIARGQPSQQLQERLPIHEHHGQERPGVHGDGEGVSSRRRVDPEIGVCEGEVSGGRDGQELGDALHRPEQDRRRHVEPRSGVRRRGHDPA